MDRTLFTPPMIETFRACRRAYQLAYVELRERKEPANSICKRFILRALAEINRGRLTTVSQVQKYMGQTWPVEKLGPDEAVKAFLFAYKTLTNSVISRYKPDQSRVVGVSLRVRARIPHERVYLEDTFDLILWYPEERRLEFVDFHLHPLKPFNPVWPPATVLVKQFLAERLRCRWPFEKLSMTFCRIGPRGFNPVSISLDEAVYRLHWPELTKTIAEMNEPAQYPPHRDTQCSRCQLLEQAAPAGLVGEAQPLWRTA